jgi:acetolactate synthase-1/2/3 large subunit
VEYIKSIANNLISSNVKNSFGIPGGGMSLDLIDELEKNGINFHLNKFEGAASIMAATTGFLSDEVGVSISIKGPGLVNAIPGIAFAHFESFPMVHITEAYNSNASESFAHKRLDQNLICNSFVKRIDYFDSKKNSFLSNIIHAKEEEPGPVIIQLAEGDKVKSENYLVNGDGLNKKKSFSFNNQIFDKTKRPLIIIGSLANRKKLNKFFEKIRIPIFTTVSAKGFIDETIEFSAGIYTGVGLSLTSEYDLINKADLIICLGLTAKEVLKVESFKTRSINYELFNSNGIDGFKFDERIHINYFEEIIGKLEEFSWGRIDIKNCRRKLIDFTSKYFLPGQVYQFINDKYIDNSRIILDTGNFCTIGEHVIQARGPKNVIMSSQSRFMGTSLPMGIASSIYDNSHKTIIFVGDGGIGMFLSEVELAVNLKLSLVIILLSDYSFASIRSRAIKNKLTQKPLIMKRNSWINVFEGFDIPSVRVDNLSGFMNAMSYTDSISGPTFIEVVFNQDQYLTMTDNIR